MSCSSSLWWCSFFTLPVAERPSARVPCLLNASASVWTSRRTFRTTSEKPAKERWFSPESRMNSSRFKNPSATGSKKLPPHVPHTFLRTTNCRRGCWCGLLRQVLFDMRADCNRCNFLTSNGLFRDRTGIHEATMKPHHHRAGTLFPCRFPGETGSGSGETQTRNQRLLDAVLKRLRRLPDETGPQCNPSTRRTVATNPPDCRLGHRPAALTLGSPRSNSDLRGYAMARLRTSSRIEISESTCWELKTPSTPCGFRSV